MICDYRINKKENLEINEWAGGRTTQFSIYPEESKYQDRNFIWRLSSATVEAESSVFTSLPDYNRILMVLDGKLELNHNDIEIINLNTFDQNLFDGASSTKSIGKAVDFNLMMRKDKCTGKVKALSIKSKEKIAINEIVGFYNDSLTFAVYAYKSNMEISIVEDAKFVLKQGDILFINPKEKLSNLKLEIENQSEDEARIIITEIFY